jgi:hypothetical protein
MYASNTTDAATSVPSSKAVAAPLIQEDDLVEHEHLTISQCFIRLALSFATRSQTPSPGNPLVSSRLTTSQGLRPSITLDPSNGTTLWDNFLGREASYTLTPRLHLRLGTVQSSHCCPGWNSVQDSLTTGENASKGLQRAACGRRATTSSRMGLRALNSPKLIYLFIHC